MWTGDLFNHNIRLQEYMLDYMISHSQILSTSNTHVKFQRHWANFCFLADLHSKNFCVLRFMIERSREI